MPAPTSSRSCRLNRRRFLQAATIAGAAPIVAGRAHAMAATASQAPAGVSPVATATGADVASLFPFIHKQAVQGTFPMSFLNPRFGALDTWTRTARAKVLDLLHYAPPPCPPAADTLERVDCGDYVREKVTFSTTPDVRVPAYVLVPKSASPTKQVPAIVALHDHGGFYLWGKEKRPSTMPRARVDAFNARAGQNEPLVGRTIYSAGFTWPGVMFWDDIRTVDYLLSRRDVDPGRIGCVGLSVGAVRSAHLVALDERIKAAVVVCWMTSFPAQLKKHVRNTIGHTKVVPGLQRHLDYPDVAAIAMPRAVLYMSGTRDGLFDLDAVKASFATLNACYAKAGIPDRCRTRLYDSPHQFTAAMQIEAWAWLQRFV